MLSAAHIKVQHWIFCPFLFQFLNGKSLEQIFLSLKVALESGYKQRLSKTARAPQKEIHSAGVCHTVYVFRLVDIEFVFPTDSLKCLYS